MEGRIWKVKNIYVKFVCQLLFRAFRLSLLQTKTNSVCFRAFVSVWRFLIWKIVFSKSLKSFIFYPIQNCTPCTLGSGYKCTYTERLGLLLSVVECGKSVLAKEYLSFVWLLFICDDDDDDDDATYTTSFDCVRYLLSENLCRNSKMDNFSDLLLGFTPQ